MNQNKIDVSIGHINDAMELDLNQFLDININKIQNKERKFESLYARYLLDKLIEEKIGMSLEGSGFYKDEKGKPLLKKASNYFISISHSNGLVAVGLGNVEFGIDIEKEMDDNYKFLEVAFQPKHWELIKNDKQDVIYSFCKLEAYSKLLGTGFMVEPKEYKVSEDLYVNKEKIFIENNSYHFVCVSLHKSNFTINSLLKK
jgi:phosphopantetheinyl transferase